MTSIGYQALIIALVLSAYSIVAYILGRKTHSAKYIESANNAVYANFILITISSVALLYALITRDFQVEYVAHYSNRALSLFYTITAFWAGQDGSLLLWDWMLTLFAVIVVVQSRKKNQELLPYIMVIINFTLLFFIYLTAFKTNPFSRTPFVPEDGTGLNPLLQNPGMIFHPPSLYLGFVGFTVPFAFAIAALITNKLDEQWIKSVRRWTLFAWLFLTIGNILGMQWAYVELGWGGYWAWDPVENASLLPWLTGTAFLHSVIVQERKRMLRIWNMWLIVITFALTIFGTFVTRSGLISSVHAFGVSDLGPLFLGFLAIVLVGSGWLIFKRHDQLKSDRELGTWTSKESSFMLNNLLFIALSVGVFIGTTMPSISEAMKGEKLTVGTQFFNRMAVPIGMAIFLLIGVCALLSWSKTSREKLLKNFTIPTVSAMFTVVVLVLFGIRQAIPLLAFAIAAFATSTIVMEFVRGTLVRMRSEKVSFFKALVTLAARNKRRYGGYIVHLGVLMLFFGITGSSAFSVKETKTLKKGEEIAIGPYQLVFQGLQLGKKGDMQVIAAILDVSKNGKPIGTIKSDKHIHPNYQPVTEVGIRSTLAEDLYVILANYNVSTQMATISVLIEPLVLWMWLGGIVMVIGTLFAMLPGRRKSPAVVTT